MRQSVHPFALLFIAVSALALSSCGSSTGSSTSSGIESSSSQIALSSHGSSPSSSDHQSTEEVITQITASEFFFSPTDDETYSPTDVETVKIISYMCEGYDDGMVIAEAPFKNKGFTIDLPKTVSSSCLGPLSTSLLKIDEVLTVSDPSAKGLFAISRIEGHDQGDQEVGSFSPLVQLVEEEEMISSYYIQWSYVDRDVIVSGEYYDKDEDEDGSNERIDEVYLKLKKGWNAIYVNSTFNGDRKNQKMTKVYSTQKPSNVTFRWIYKSEND